MSEHVKLGSPLLDDVDIRVENLEAIIVTKDGTIKNLNNLIKLKDIRIAELERSLELAERFIAISGF